MTDMQMEVCKLALKKMMDEGRFSICAVDQILKLTGGVPEKADYETLRALHCVEFKEFSPLMRIEFPRLLKRVLESPSMELQITFKPLTRPLTLLN